MRGINTTAAQVVVTPGAKPIMFYLLLALGEPGVEIIYPNPGFPIYESMIKFSGATPVPMRLLEETGYHPDLDALAGQITDKTRLLIPEFAGEPLRLGPHPRRTGNRRRTGTAASRPLCNVG